MMLALGVGSWAAAIFHLLTHAFFKALLFLGAGSVIHAAHHEQDIRQLGALRGPMRVTFVTFAIGTMALAGVPFLFSGFWSKEAILHAAHGWSVSHVPFYVALVAVVLTAFYMTRLVSQAFFGRARSEAAAHAHESPPAMTVPLILLAVCAILVGFVGTPYFPWLQHVLAGSAEPEPVDYSLTALSVVLVALGIGSGWALYGRRPRVTATAPDPLAARSPAVWTALEKRLRFDELYAATVFKLNAGLASFADALDRHVLDGSIRFLTRLAQFTGAVSRESDEDVINGGFDRASNGLRRPARLYSRAQSGDAHGHLRVLAAAFVVIVLIVMLGGTP
jgi:NADH-quinone oxidoreductase subunit L